MPAAALRQQAVDRLHATGCSCVVLDRNGRMHSFTRRGVADLYDLVANRPDLLSGAFVADKVVGKGAAALMIAGGVRGLYADVVSRPALELLSNSGIPAEAGSVVAGIINRSGTGPCPVETLCAPCPTASECLPLIAAFINEKKP